jgi:hypothetical protein
MGLFKYAKHQYVLTEKRFMKETDTLKLSIADDSQRDIWNSYLDGKTGLPPLQRYEWKYILESTYGVISHQIMAMDNLGNVRGILPFYGVKDSAGRKILFSLKFGLVADSETAAMFLQEKMRDIMLHDNAAGGRLTSGLTQWNLDLPSRTMKTVLLHLPESEEKMWASIRGKAKNMVRRAEREGIKVERGHDKLEEFYDVYSDRMLQKRVQIHSFDFFSNIFKWMGNSAELFIARDRQEIVGGMFLVHWNGTGGYIYGGSIVDRGVSPNQLLLWEMVRYCIQNGVSLLDLGESTEGSGAYNFKIWFGGVPEDIHYYDLEGSQGFLYTSFCRPVYFFRSHIMRLIAYGGMKYGSPAMKQRLGIWKRRTGPLQ